MFDALGELHPRSSRSHHREKAVLIEIGSLGNISLAGSTRELGNLRQNRQRQERRGSIEPLVTIKCQRLNSDRRREEVSRLNTL